MLVMEWRQDMKHQKSRRPAGNMAYFVLHFIPGGQQII
jgi:hypothetical protein